MTFCTPSLPGSSQQDSPSLTGWGIAGLSGQQESSMDYWKTLRATTEFTSLPDFVPERTVDSFHQCLGAYVTNDAHGLWEEPEERHDGHTAANLAVAIGQRINAVAHVCNGNSTQSPIEEMLLGALVWIDKDWGGMPEASLFSSPREQLKVGGPRDKIEFFIAPQAEIAGYKADFLMWFTFDRVFAGVAIECDGHAFHEKTKEQAARDKKRDREILAAGFPVARFSGSEIFKSPKGCADQVCDLLSDALDRVSRAAGLYA